MIWVLVIVLVATGIVMIAARAPLARAQALLFGGTMLPGCVVAEAVILFVLAVASWLLRHHIE